ncbi:DUF4097 family beta strand repeat protein [candidate division KSB1 bacterium]|nr:DUF4097 family beta strand repeat protein [candidate division KSB1 bacterium]
MKTLTRILIAIVVLSAIHVIAQDDLVDRLTVPFSDPSKPGKIEAGLINGSITVTGYPGKEVVIEAESRMKQLDDDFDVDEEIVFDGGGRSTGRSRSRSRTGDDEENDKDLSGLKRLSGTTSSLEVSEEDNFMEINAASWKNDVDLRIKVPHRTSVELSTVNNGNIVVTDVTGELEVKAINGSVRMENVGGVVVANSHNGGVTVVMNKLDAGKPMAFTSFNGDVDITLPALIKANVKMKTQNGEIYTDFEIQKSKDPASIVQDKTHDEDGAYHVKIDRSYYGMVNGGGPEFNLKTFNGDIVIRKGK